MNFNQVSYVKDFNMAPKMSPKISELVNELWKKNVSDPLNEYYEFQLYTVLNMFL
jgi:sulfur relay (sulfurtransferase) DsrC/TusE family protein